MKWYVIFRIASGVYTLRERLTEVIYMLPTLFFHFSFVIHQVDSCDLLMLVLAVRYFNRHISANSATPFPVPTCVTACVYSYIRCLYVIVKAGNIDIRLSAIVKIKYERLYRLQSVTILTEIFDNSHI